MKLSKCFSHALNMVLHSKLRSWLTIIGIVIGVASVIAIVSLGEGMNQQLNEQMNGLGSDIITITPGYNKASSSLGPGRFKDTTSTSSDDILDKSDVQALKSIPEIKNIETEISGSAKLYYMGSESSSTITGVDQKVWSDIATDEIGQGRMLGPSDTNVIVIGYTLATTFFDDEIGINKILTIEEKAFRVVGILEEGTKTSIYMPISAAYEVLSDDKTKDEYDKIIVQIKEDVDIELITEKIEDKLMMTRHVTEKTKDFTVSNMLQTASMISDMTGTLTLFLTSIAAVSLLVGAIGIANTMFTSVLEKTKEIGIMKAIGAQNKDILIIFLLNAGVIGLVGGVIGLLLGIVASGFLGMALGTKTIVSTSIMIIALVVSIGVGMIAGFIPAYQASKLKPVDALRYE